MNRLTSLSLLAAVLLPASIPGVALAQTAAQPATQVGGLEEYFDNYWQMVATAKSEQPEWSSPVVTTTALLEERVRFDTQFQHAGNDTDTINLDGGKGVNFIVAPTEELQVQLPPYVVRTAPKASGDVYGWNDWTPIRFKQRLLSSPEDAGNYIVAAWLNVGVPVGVSKLTNHAVTLQPTLGFGKGWGAFDIQGTVGWVIPVTYEGKLGEQFQGNLAFQYHLLTYFWPQLEVNYTEYPNGQRAGLNQVFLTPGLVLGRFPLTKDLKMTVGVGYQVAVAPSYRAKPLTPAYDRAWILTTRVSF
jgi:hypothetical protein